MKRMGEKNKNNYEYPSLYDYFKLGDRVMRSYYDKYGKKTEYKGVILKIEQKGLEVYWDTQNGRYKPGEIGVSFTHCDLEEIFNGKKEYSPIKKERSYF
jgi:hypothetical protein